MCVGNFDVGGVFFVLFGFVVFGFVDLNSVLIVVVEGGCCVF